MNGKWLSLTGFMFFLYLIPSFAQPDWERRQDKEGIAVYTKNIDNAKLPICSIKDDQSGGDVSFRMEERVGLRRLCHCSHGLAVRPAFNSFTFFVTMTERPAREA